MTITQTKRVISLALIAVLATVVALTVVSFSSAAAEPGAVRSITMGELMRVRILMEEQQAALQAEAQTSSYWYQQHKELEECVVQAAAEGIPATTCLVGYTGV